ncbi:MAG TPA: flagellar basal body P-ring formation chaperone FlgA [Bryobacteraceae bacterium]|nr:flagellar basal body P-ring formation chaperone FlgA [Bryobacteraceae bacterium]
MLRHTRIYARDLAELDERFAKLPPDRFLGYAPAPGYQRSFSAGELGLMVGPDDRQLRPIPDVCFEWSMTSLEPSSVLASMKDAMGQDADIRVVEVSRYPVPTGPLVFSVAGLQRSGSGPRLWRGYVQYGGSEKFQIWAKVELKVLGKRLMATRSIAAGTTITAEHFQLEEGHFSPEALDLVSTPEEVVGKVTRLAISQGHPIRATQLQSAPDIKRGDSVTVRVQSGMANITLQALAMMSGSRGQKIRFRNESSGKVFQARVQDRGLAVIDDPARSAGEAR